MKKIRLIKHTAALALLLYSPFFKCAEASKTQDPEALVAAELLCYLGRSGDPAFEGNPPATLLPPLLANHSAAPSTASTCPRCKEDFSNRKSGLYAHEGHTRMAQKANKLCPKKDCCHISLMPEDVNEHVRVEHKGETIYACSVCFKTFQRRSSSSAHFKCRHKGTGEIMLLCAGCLEWHPHKERGTHVCAPAASALESESPLHLQPTAQPVAIDPKPNFIPAALTAALEEKTSSQKIKGRACIRCKAFYSLKSFNQHVSSIEKAEEEKTLCTQNDCCHIGQTSRDVDEHVRSVHEQKIIYGCSLCDKKFKGRSAPHNHFHRVHADHGEKTLKCAGCSVWHPHKERETHVCAPAAVPALENDGHTQKRARLDGETN